MKNILYITKKIHDGSPASVNGAYLMVVAAFLLMTNVVGDLSPSFCYDIKDEHGKSVSSGTCGGLPPCTGAAFTITQFPDNYTCQKGTDTSRYSSCTPQKGTADALVYNCVCTPHEVTENVPEWVEECIPEGKLGEVCKLVYSIVAKKVEICNPTHSDTPGNTYPVQIDNDQPGSPCPAFCPAS